MQDNKSDRREIEQDILTAVSDLRAKIQTLDVPKSKDSWDRFSILSSFIGSVLLASVGL